ncbi:M48 family metallopeptidase [Gammaproteobacteria bacterium]|nr:M48 family metallopeptidase [Gammaproteobacteria bacterium]
MSEVAIIIFIYLFAKVVLDILQIYTIKNAMIDTQSMQLLDISIDDDKKSRQYNISKLNLSIMKNIFYVGYIYLLFLGGLFKYINTSINHYDISLYIIDLASILTVYIIIHISMLPFSFYSNFVIETKYQFNTSTKILFFKDNLISLVMTLLVISLLSLIFFYIVTYQNLWWLLMSLTMFSLIIISMFIYPTYISPIFNKFKKLNDENIKDEIKDLSKKTNFSIENLFIMDRSKRSKHPNAYFTGFKSNRRIVFYDTLIDLLSAKEIKAVLAHEIGHYKHNHIVKSLILSSIVIFIGMFLLSQLINSNHYLEILNLPISASSQLVALFFTYQVVSFFTDPFFSTLSRKNEYEADTFASNQVEKEYLISSLTKLYKSNLSFLIPNKFYALFYFSHPTVLERINNLRSNNE